MSKPSFGTASRPAWMSGGRVFEPSDAGKPFLTADSSSHTSALKEDVTFAPNLPRAHLPRFESALNKSSEAFAKNTSEMQELLKDLKDRLKDWDSQGDAHRQQAHLQRGKLLGRQRLELVLDQDSPFLELNPLTGQDIKNVPKGNPLIGGIGLVSGMECVIVSYVPTVGSGSLNLLSGAKWNRFHEVAMECRLPFIQLLESSGAELTEAFEVFHTRPGPFYSLARMSKEKIPSIAVVFGTCIAGGAYLAGMSDYTIMVKDNAQLALAGSKLVNVATGEISTDEELGGARMHSTTSGSSEYFAESEVEAVRQCRELVSSFPPPNKRTVFPHSFLPSSNPAGLPCQEPYYDPQELLGIASPSAAHSNYDAKEVICRIVDGSELVEFKPLFGSTMVCVWAYVYGVPVGILSNNGVVLPSSAQKAAHFINLCSQRGSPIIFLHNVTGFMVGQQYEREGMLKWGSQMINAMSNASVPCISILIGSSFGAANFAMCGRGYYPRFIFSWPTAKCAVMGPDQLSGVMELLAKERQARTGVKDEEKTAMMKAMLKARIEQQMSALNCTQHGIDDGIIDPRETRRVLGVVLSACCNAGVQPSESSGLARL